MGKCPETSESCDRMCQTMCHRRSEELATLRAKVAELEKDRERLDWLESQATPGLVWEARQSRTGRGYRLHQHSSEYLGDAVDTGATARSAIDAAMAQGERTNGD